MFSVPVDNSYALLAAFLTPCKREEHLQALRRLIAEERIVWTELVYQANLQLCTPLWYVQLTRDGLLGLLPEDLQEYLGHLHQANVERNAEMRQGLEELLQQFAQQGIATLLLKGAATFCDDLYGDPGARVMGDLDILVKPQQVEAARQVLVKLGYLEIPNQGMEFEGLATDERHHQLPRYHKPATPVVVEIHFKVSYGQSGRVLPAAAAWENAQETSFAGLRTSLLNPTWRLLHNAVHALLPHCEFIRGDLALARLVEFVALASRYQQQIDWSQWQQVAVRQQLKTEFSVYQDAAETLLFLPTGIAPISGLVTGFHRRRILAIGKAAGAHQANLWTILTRFYYYLNLPLWVWRNVCYIDGGGQISARLKYLLKKVLSARSRAKVGV